MMGQVAKELDRQTNVLRLCQAEPHVLDLCAAPGGFSATVLELHRGAKICGITLPTEMGGHPMLLPYGSNDSRVNINFIDITELGAESQLRMMSTNSNGLSVERPFHDLRFELVICDGQVLRTHASYRVQTRERFEARRLTCSQLIMGLHRIRNNGTSIMLLHKPESWRTLLLLHQFCRFSDIQLFKPRKTHASRSSFYLVAKSVKPLCPEAQAALIAWEEDWKHATFMDPSSAEPEPDAEQVSGVLAEFGEQFLKIAAPICEVQRQGLEKAPWLKP